MTFDELPDEFECEICELYGLDTPAVHGYAYLELKRIHPYCTKHWIEFVKSYALDLAE